MPPSRLPYLPLALVALAALIGFRASLVGFDPGPDESWMVLVTTRLAHGDRLYQDVFCGVTPLAFQLHTAIQAVFGATLAVTRGLGFLLYALSALLVLATGVALRLTRLQLVFLLAATLAWTVPDNTSSYSAWATLFELGAQYAAIRSLQSPHAARWAAAAGLAAGLAFASKQNVGLLSCAALLLGLALFRRRLLPVAAGAFVLAAALPLVPIALAGGLPALSRYGFFNKSVYASVAAVSYQSFVYLTPMSLWSTDGLPVGTLLWGRSLLYLVPVVIPLAVVRLLGPRREALRLHFIFAVAAFASVYPRPDHPHMLLYAPFAALSLALALPASRACRWAAAAFGGLLLLQFFVWTTLLLNPLRATVPGTTAFQGLRVSPTFAKLAASAALLSAEQQGAKGIFLLHPNAPTLYLAAGVPNPTPYDYPLNSAFGPHGQEEMIHRLRTGEISLVCLPDQPWATDYFWNVFLPTQLVHYVRTEMVPGPDRSVCQIYRPR